MDREHERTCIVPGTGKTARRQWSVTWIPATVLPVPEFVTRAEGYCITDDGQAVLVRLLNDRDWVLPGGRLEPGETALDALIREAFEEACVGVKEFRYLGCVRVEDLDGADNHRVDCEAVFWARVELREWTALKKLQNEGPYLFGR